MKFALINGLRQEAQPNLSGQCPSCSQSMIAKCGEIKIWHWAHKGRRTCDPWWENESEWHRKWKGLFPEDWQEVVHQANNGEKHIADVKTDQGWAIEFQHSYINPEERRSRNGFYQKLVWVVDGTRRKRDRAQFSNALNEGMPVGSNSQIRRAFSEECALLKEWKDCNAPVFIDFGGEQILWWLLKGNADGSAYVAPFSHSEFVNFLRGGSTQAALNFESFVNDLSKLVSDYESYLKSQTLRQASSQIPNQFQQYSSRRSRHQRRF
jgi:hypothetical protein